MAFVSTPTACATTGVSREDFTKICRLLSGRIAGLVVVKSGNSIECPSDTTEMAAAVNTGLTYDPIHTIRGEVPEPSPEVVESDFLCVGDLIKYWTESWDIFIPFSYENQAAWREVAAGNYSQILITTEEGLGYEIVGIRSVRVTDYSEGEQHTIKVNITTRIAKGVRQYFKAKYPLYDPACAAVGA